MEDTLIEGTEMMLLGASLEGRGEEVWSKVKPEMFTPGPRQTAAFICQRLTDEGVDYDLLRVVREAQAVPASKVTPDMLVGCLQAARGDVGYHAGVLLREDMARTGRMLLTRALQRLSEPEADPFAILSDVSEESHAVALPLYGGEPWWDYEDVIDMSAADPEWVIPDVLGRRDRVVMTGGEGMGKSTLLAQVALGVMWGVHPFEPNYRMDPARIAVLDVENSHEQQIANTWRRLHSAYSGMAETRAEARLLRWRDIDLMDPSERLDMIRTTVKADPSLLVMGAAYKLTGYSEDYRRSATAIQGTVDRIRAEIGCAVIVEHHSGHGVRTEGKKADRNGGRPEGSSNWMKWPEFGLWLDVKDRDRRIALLDRWRGDRTLGRKWPHAFRGGGRLPFTAISADQWEAEYAHLY